MRGRKMWADSGFCGPVDGGQSKNDGPGRVTAPAPTRDGMQKPVSRKRSTAICAREPTSGFAEEQGPMRPTRESSGDRQKSVATVNAPTRLGDATACKKGGRYARLMGDLWRHEKTEKVGDAALGLLMRLYSFCADQGVDHVSEKRMVDLFRGNPNGRRQLNQLIAAEFVDVVPGGGYSPHDWYEHNRVAKPVKLRIVPTPPVMNMGGLCDDDVMNTPPENIQEPCVPRARAETQDPGIKERTPPAGAVARPAETPKRVTPKPRKRPPRDARKAQFRELLKSTCREHGLLSRDALRPKQLEEAVGKAEEYAEREGIEFEAAALKLLGDAAAAVKAGQKSALCWAVRDWQPGVAPPQQRPLRYVGPKPCTPAEEFPDVDVEVQLEALRNWNKPQAAS